MEKFPDIVYITGYGRSGSTLLETLISQSRDVFGAGEITWLFRYFRTGEMKCSCGSRLDECEFWNDIVDRVLRKTTCESLEEAASLTLRNEKMIHIGSQSDEYSMLWRRTFQEIRQKSGCRIIIDSSKTSRLAFDRLPLLAKAFGPSIKVIHMVRDPRAVMWSVQRGSNRLMAQGRTAVKLPGGRLRGLAGWMLSNALAERAMHLHPELQVLRIRYEDLVAQPTATLRRLSTFLGKNIVLPETQPPSSARIPAAHSVAGNRMRASGSLRLKADNAWRQNLTPLSRLISISAWPQMRKYGYPVFLPDTEVPSE